MSDAVYLDTLDILAGRVCCSSHVGGATPGGCCDPDDCGPCCPNCPTCPGVARSVARGPRAVPGLLEAAAIRALRGLTSGYGSPVRREHVHAAAGALDALAELQRRSDRATELLAALRVLCPCDPNPETTDGPQRECPLHGEPATAVELLRLGVEFRAQVFDHRAWRKGRAWAHSTVVNRMRALAPEAADAQDRHYVRQVTRYGELISRMMGRLVGFREGVAELAEQGDERRHAWRTRA